MATDNKKCDACGKEITPDERLILKDVMAGRHRERVGTHNETMQLLGMPESPLEPPDWVLDDWPECAACYNQNEDTVHVGNLLDFIIERPWLHPGVFQYEEI